MLTCKKVYSDIPIAHRQHRHDGHCARIHGHNWAVGVTFGCHEVDANGFVVDFGKVKYLRDWLAEHLDHACLFNEDDPLRKQLLAAAPECWKSYVVKDCSCEGLARHLYDVFDRMVRDQTQGRAFVVAVEVAEDSKNSATFAPAN
jgi:6-pyruvoyltetrahydropterin/6-carboxytetrahydropterin synthase